MQMQFTDSEKAGGTHAYASQQYGDILKLRRNHMEIPAQAVLNGCGDLIQKSRNIICEGTVKNDDIRVKGVQDRIQADCGVVDKIMKGFLC